MRDEKMQAPRAAAGMYMGSKRLGLCIIVAMLSYCSEVSNMIGTFLA